ncbi:MAG: putative nucleotide-disulfide oxidoreductase [Caulobacter sp.]|nr:putative nucleotide-disulfide oxidoreductase [Caulobacter sp.]
MSDDLSNDPSILPTFGGRMEQAFPTLTPAEIGRMQRFGEVRRYRDGEALFTTGVTTDGMFVILSGHVAITQRDGLGHVTPVTEQGVGQFLAEVGQLSGRAALVDGHAEGDVEALVIPPEALRRLLVAEAELGERIVRALILRRVNLIESQTGGAVLIGAAHGAGVARLQNFLTRNGHPHHLLDPEVDAEARELTTRYAAQGLRLPLVVTPDGRVLSDPSETDLAHALGMVGAPTAGKIHDVAVVGAGPAGLATAVYATSEGLSVALVDCRAYGGQAGASARIENYLGFPTGISGQALAGRAFVQAQKFGAEPMIPWQVASLDCSRRSGVFVLRSTEGEEIRAKAVVVASGASYRRPAVARLEEFESRGVWYWASPVEARLCAGETVMLVGGGNSAGQAAVFLSGHARVVKMLVRGQGLAASMSRYLIDRIEAAANIELITEAEVLALDGDPGIGLEAITWHDRAGDIRHTETIRNLFLFVGADPATGWLGDCGVALDNGGFVITGMDDAPLLQSSVAGVFAVGDVRCGSVKRVGAAIGEGAQVVAALHGYLADAPVTTA